MDMETVLTEQRARDLCGYLRDRFPHCCFAVHHEYPESKEGWAVKWFSPTKEERTRIADFLDGWESGRRALKREDAHQQETR